jgi:hypothetical protein
MISAVVIVCTAVVLGSILPVAVLVTRGSGSRDDRPPVADRGEGVSAAGGDDSGEAAARGHRSGGLWTAAGTGPGDRRYWGR